MYNSRLKTSTSHSHMASLDVAVGAYRAVRARGFRASKVLLYAIEGALLNVHWSELPPAHKAELNGKLDEAQGHNKS